MLSDRLCLKKTLNEKNTITVLFPSEIKYFIDSILTNTIDIIEPTSVESEVCSSTFIRELDMKADALSYSGILTISIKQRMKFQS